MIVDTSALIAVLAEEVGYKRLLVALLNEPVFLPAPAHLEFLSVARGARFDLGDQADALLARLTRLGMEMLPWNVRHATIAAEAQLRYGKGNGRGGVLNLLDLMVYAVAKERGEALLFAGRDFTTTDVLVHPASRVD
ncbi:type II toxin-antitoxin system VapC family toxin [Sphingomonas sp.]|uniref:type II toxin-antitoxin system VapC family toxin n=1 Tax=Sphingomonas sp. TaxID=28214 RepID=UPI00333F74E7